MTSPADDLDRVGAAYLAHLTEADLQALVRAEQTSATESAGRIGALRREPQLVLAVLDRPATSAAILNLAGERSARRFSFISPFLVFAAAVHRTAADLAARPHAPERAGPRMRVPVFDTAELAGYLAAPRRRLFLAELLASFARISSGVAITRTPRGTARRRWNDLDPVRLAMLLEAMPEPQRSGVWRRLGDLALFLGGVFPDAAEQIVAGPADAVRLARITGLPATPPPGVAAPELIEWFGAHWYRLAADRALAATSATTILRDSADHFHQARRVLNAATDRYLLPVTTGWFTPPR